VDITFARGVPTALNRVAMPLIELVGSLGTLAVTHGVGHARAESLLCDAPAAVLLHAAHRELTRAASAADVQQFSEAATSAYVEIIEGARWFSPLRQALDAYVDAVQGAVNGHVQLRLFRGTYATIATELAEAGAPRTALRVISSSTQH
jgi:argininosuccinate synthase